MPIRQSSLLAFVFSVTFLVSATNVAWALAVVDQEYLPIPDLISSVGSQTELAQSFTVGVTGQLTGFDIAVQRNPNAVVTQPLLYDIRRTVGGVPEDDAGILASGSVSAQNISDVGPVFPQLLPSLTHIDIAGASLQVTAGDVLAIVLRSNDPGQIGNGFAYEWYGLSSFAWFHPASSPYNRGSAFYPNLDGQWVPNQTTDLAFRTEVSLAGDYNEDGHVNAADITALELALTNLSLYKSTYGVSDADLLQLNQLESNTDLNVSDLQALLNYLKSGGGSVDPVPEPSTLALLTLGGVIAFALKRRAA